VASGNAGLRFEATKHLNKKEYYFLKILLEIKERKYQFSEDENQNTVLRFQKRLKQ
jgi:hypothetical protein